MKTLSSSQVILAGMALLVAACGQSTPGTPARKPAVTTGFQDAVPLPVASGAPQTDAAVKARVDAAVARLDAVKTCTGKVVFDEWKDGVSSSSPASEHGEASIAFRTKPFAARVDILDSNRWLAAGGSLIWKGGTTLKIRPFHMPFSMDFSYDNGQVVSVRGFRIDQTDLFSMAKVLRHPATRLKPLGERTYGGQTFYCVDVVSPASCKGITHELIGVSNAWNIPAYREMYAGDRLVHRGVGHNLRFDQPVSADRFEF